MLALVVLQLYLLLLLVLRASLCPAVLLAGAGTGAAAAAAEGTTSAHAATLFAGGLPLLLQCLPGFLLPLLCRCSSPTSDSKIQSDNKQRTGRRAVRQGNESAAGIGDYQPRAARSSAISGLTRPIFLTKSSEFGPRTSLGKADGPRTRTNRAAFDCQHTESRSFLKEKEITVFFCLRAWPPTCRFSPSETALPGRGSAALRRTAARAAPRGGATWAQRQRSPSAAKWRLMVRTFCDEGTGKRTSGIRTAAEPHL